jgi:tetratricopeptide (TPR) repeat protein
MSRVLVVFVACVCGAAQDRPEFADGRKARDQADVGALQKMIENTRQAASTAKTQLRVAQLDFFLCEAAYVQGKNDLIKGAAEEGLAAAEKATTLDPSSSEAHRLRSDLAAMLIALAPDGVAKYGARTSVEAQNALELDPNNANALSSRSLGYFYTPEQYGGDKDKAFELLKKAVQLVPAYDTPHLLLAQLYNASDRKEDAVREINEAVRLNPERRFSLNTQAAIVGAKTGK